MDILRLSGFSIKHSYELKQFGTPFYYNEAIGRASEPLTADEIDKKNDNIISSTYVL